MAHHAVGHRLWTSLRCIDHQIHQQCVVECEIPIHGNLLRLHSRCTRLYAFQHDFQQHHAKKNTKETAEEAMAPQLNEKRWITRSQVDPVTAWNKQACYAAVRCVQAAGRGSTKGAMHSVQIGVTRCDDKCENTVLLETQGPCGSVRASQSFSITIMTASFFGTRQ